MQDRREVTVTVRALHNRIRRLALTGLPQDERLTPMQGRIIGFVRHSPGDVFQRDLEAEFEIRRSTASAILQGMERNGLLRREPVARDARLKKLVLTPSAVRYSECFHREMANVEARLTQGVSAQELAAFFALMERFENNLSAYAEGLGGASGASPAGEEKA